MPECRNCGSFVTKRYVRVRSRDDDPGIRCCPNCEDKIWDGSNEVREARSTRHQPHNAGTGYDPAKDPGVDVSELVADGGGERGE